MSVVEDRTGYTCSEHGEPVTIRIPVNEFGNAHGERWHCPKCTGEPQKIGKLVHIYVSPWTKLFWMVIVIITILLLI
jgi:hypothetical protein